MDIASSSPTRERLLAFLRNLEPAARVIGAACLAAAVAAFVWLGIGGRVAMRVVTLTSDRAFRGIRTDDGFVIGDFDLGNTLAFVVFLTIAGTAFGGVVYTLMRVWLRGTVRLRVLAAGVLGATVGGNLLVHTDGIDFRILGPLWVTVGLFALIPALYGMTTVLGAEWLLRPGGWARRGSAWPRVFPAGALVIPPVALLTVPALLVALILKGRGPQSLLRNPGVAFLGWLGVLALSTLSVVALAGKVADLA